MVAIVYTMHNINDFNMRTGAPTQSFDLDQLREYATYQESLDRRVVIVASGGKVAYMSPARPPVVNPRTMISIDVADVITDTYTEMLWYRDAMSFGTTVRKDAAYEAMDRWSCEVNLMARDYDEGSIDHAVLNTLALLSERVLTGGE